MWVLEVVIYHSYIWWNLLFLAATPFYSFHASLNYCAWSLLSLISHLSCLCSVITTFCGLSYIVEYNYAYASILVSSNYILLLSWVWHYEFQFPQHSLAPKVSQTCFFFVFEKHCLDPSFLINKSTCLTEALIVANSNPLSCGLVCMRVSIVVAEEKVLISIRI